MKEAKEEAAYTIIEFVKSPDMFQVSYYLTELDHEVIIQFVKHCSSTSFSTMKLIPYLVYKPADDE